MTAMLAKIEEETALLARTENGRTAYLVRPLAIEAAMRMQTRGLVRCQWGQGKDHGLLLVTRALIVRHPRPFGGGDAA